VVVARPNREMVSFMGLRLGDAGLCHEQES
jgi:hypothetical protein